MFDGRQVEVGGFSVQCQMACVKETPQICLSWVFVYLLPSPDFSIFPASPPDIVTWLKSGLNTSKGMLTDGLHLGARELSHETQLEKNVGASPKSREAGRAVLKEEVSAPFRAWSWDPREKLQGGGSGLCPFFIQTVLSELLLR